PAGGGRGACHAASGRNYATLHRCPMASEKPTGAPPSDDAEPAPDLFVGKVLAERYQIERRLGGGGMGSVYAARHTVIGRRVAVKVMHPQLAVDAAAVKRFLNEARAAGTLEHPNIALCTDFGRTDEGAPFLVMEFL